MPDFPTSYLNYGLLTEALSRLLELVLVTLVVYILYRFMRGTMVRLYGLKRVQGFFGERAPRRSETARSVMKQSLKYSFLAIYFLAVFSILAGGQIGLLASASVVGLTIGFGAQNVLKDMLAGFFFLFEGQFAVGDRVRMLPMDIVGTVEEFGLRTTRVRDGSKTHFIPNGAITSVTRLRRVSGPDVKLHYVLPRGVEGTLIGRSLSEVRPHLLRVYGDRHPSFRYRIREGLLEIEMDDVLEGTAPEDLDRFLKEWFTAREGIDLEDNS